MACLKKAISQSVAAEIDLVKRAGPGHLLVPNKSKVTEDDIEKYEFFLAQLLQLPSGTMTNPRAFKQTLIEIDNSYNGALSGAHCALAQVQWAMQSSIFLHQVWLLALRRIKAKGFARNLAVTSLKEIYEESLAPKSKDEPAHEDYDGAEILSKLPEWNYDSDKDDEVMTLSDSESQHPGTNADCEPHRHQQQEPQKETCPARVIRSMNIYDKAPVLNHSSAKWQVRLLKQNTLVQLNLKLLRLKFLPRSWRALHLAR